MAKNYFKKRPKNSGVVENGKLCVNAHISVVYSYTLVKSA